MPRRAVSTSSQPRTFAPKREEISPLRSTAFRSGRNDTLRYVLPEHYDVISTKAVRPRGEISSRGHIPPDKQFSQPGIVP